MQTSVTASQVQVLFWGMHGSFSAAPFHRLLDAGITPLALFIPAGTNFPSHYPLPYRLPQPVADSAEIPLLARAPASAEPSSAVHLAQTQGIPVYAIGRLDTEEVAALVRAYAPDVACVACFPRQIPPALLAIPRFGFLNLHPSLLPAYRGPFPLFWSWRNGDTQTGVTLHVMSPEMDRGDIVAQSEVTLPDGISGPEADTLLGEEGGRLLMHALEELTEGNLTRRPQASGGSYYPMPTAADFRLDRQWSARHAFNFMRGTAEWGHPYRVELEGKTLYLSSAVGYSMEDAEGNDRATASTGQPDMLVQIPFAVGRLTATLAESPLAGNR